MSKKREDALRVNYFIKMRKTFLICKDECGVKWCLMSLKSPTPNPRRDTPVAREGVCTSVSLCRSPERLPEREQLRRLPEGEQLKRLPE